ncbi:RagB/SusD family nutrient uptake outer membrane protein [Labilibacter sediminis]|nr:RagB/SusD family nutrient uptake outer membrane protein [Labilibacter sediminis]
MERLYKKINVLLIVMIGFSWSCSDDFLVEEPTASLPSENVFESIQTASAALVGAYDALSSYTFEGLYWPIMSDLVGEDLMLVPGSGNWGWFVETYQLEVLPNYTWVDEPWWAAYKIIYDANQLVAFAKDIPDATDEQKKAIEGEGRVIRAYVMLKLAQMYAPAYHTNPDAPSIMNVSVPVDANAEDFPRATNREVYTQIESDLLTAIDKLGSYDDKGFFDKRAAQAILARAYLDMHEWEKASKMAQAAHEGIELMKREDYYGFFYRNSETIFTVAFNATDNNTYLTIPSFYWPEFGYSSVRANDEFVNKFASADYRKRFFLLYEDIDPDRNLVLKFEHNGQVGNAERISIRASEMYLIEAECEAELGNFSAAQDALWEIQERVSARTSKSTATGQDLINEVLLERRKELFGEGFRWNDIKRRSLPFVREGDHWAKWNFTASDEDYFRLTFPIPQSEIDANPQINEEDQNVGY